jgi:hypothetical protein
LHAAANYSLHFGNYAYRAAAIAFFLVSTSPSKHKRKQNTNVVTSFLPMRLRRSLPQAE